MNLALRRPEPYGIRFTVEVPRDDGRTSLDDKVGMNVIRVDVLDRLGRQREKAKPVARPSPVAIHPHLLQSHHQRVTRLGPLDEERPGERVGRLGPFLIFLVETRRIDGLGHHRFARLDPLQNRVRMRERTVIRRGHDARRLVGHEGRSECEKRHSDGESDEIHAGNPERETVSLDRTDSRPHKGPRL